MSRGSSRRLMPEPKSVAMSGSSYRAAAALARIAADVGTGEIQLVAQHIDEQVPRLHLGRPRDAVHVEGNGARPRHRGGICPPAKGLQLALHLTAPRVASLDQPFMRR